MTTLNSLVDDVQLDLSGFTYRQDRVTYLLTAATTSDLVLNVASTENIGKSIIEIDDGTVGIDEEESRIAQFIKRHLKKTVATKP